MGSASRAPPPCAVPRRVVAGLPVAPPSPRRRTTRAARSAGSPRGPTSTSEWPSSPSRRSGAPSRRRPSTARTWSSRPRGATTRASSRARRRSSRAWCDDMHMHMHMHMHMKHAHAHAHAHAHFTCPFPLAGRPRPHRRRADAAHPARGLVHDRERRAHAIRPWRVQWDRRRAE